MLVSLFQSFKLIRSIFVKTNQFLQALVPFKGAWKIFFEKYGDFQNIENLKKNEVFQLQVEVGKKVVTSKK